MNRRRLLAVVAAGLGAGCPGAGGEQGESEPVTPAGTPAYVPSSLDCDDESASRIPSPYVVDDLASGETESFALRVNQTSFERGETAQITLRNTTSETESTGNETKYNLELRTEAGWEDVRVAPDGTPKPYKDIGIQHGPGEGFAWEIELTGSGVEAAPSPGDRRVCPGLPTGRYRFVYWGTTTPVAVAFDLRPGATADRTE